jgi:uncharacterized protein YndB with AHSA1/START domain
MTTQKDFKRLVRGRMQKTGEAYTAARASLLGLSAKRKARSAAGSELDLRGAALPPVSTNGAAPTTVQSPDLARIAGMSDAKLKEKTGCTWERWVWALDQVNAKAWPHSEIARYIHEKYKVPGWWSQTVTVGYERIRGLREKGQRRSGSWEASKSRTIGASVGTIFKAFKQPKLRSAWLPGITAVVRTSVPNKSLRLTWEDGTSVEVYLVAKGRSKTQVTIQHTKLPDRNAANRMKAFWAENLEALAAKLEPKKAQYGATS